MCLASELAVFQLSALRLLEYLVSRLRADLLPLQSTIMSTIIDVFCRKPHRALKSEELKDVWLAALFTGWSGHKENMYSDPVISFHEGVSDCPCIECF